MRASCSPLLRASPKSAKIKHSYSPYSYSPYSHAGPPWSILSMPASSVAWSTRSMPVWRSTKNTAAADSVVNAATTVTPST